MPPGRTPAINFDHRASGRHHPGRRSRRAAGNPTPRAIRAALLVLAAFTLLDAGPALADVRLWLVASGTWDDPTNWSDGLVPTATDTPYINNGGTALLPAGVSGTAAALNIGSSGTSSLIISGGVLTDTDAYLGYGAGTTGAATITGGTWSSSGPLDVGFGGKGILAIAGGSVSSSNVYLGINAGSSGAADVSGGILSGAFDLVVGYSGAGTVAVTGGGVTCVNAFLGSDASGNGTVTVSSGTFHGTATFRVGSSGTGSLAVTNSGAVVVGGGTGTMVLGVFGDSVGTLNIGTGGTAGTLQAKAVTGLSGTATVNFNHTGTIAFAPDLVGSLRVTKAGPGTTVVTGSNTYAGDTAITSGTLQIGNGGATGTLGGGAVTADATLAFNRSGSLSVPNAISGWGRLRQIGPGLTTLTGANSYSGGTTVKSGTLAVAVGGAINHPSATLVVGESIGDNGTVALAGGSITTYESLLANAAGASGAAVVTGGTWTDANSLKIGEYGSGSLSMSGGRINSGWIAIGNDTPATGIATVTGGTWSNSVNLVVGVYGTGNLTIAGGRFTTANSYIGHVAGAKGTVAVSSGTFSNTATLIVGNLGSGTMSLVDTGVGIAGGGTGTLTLAQNGGSAGTLNIGLGAAAGTLQAGAVHGGAGTAAVNFNHTGSIAFTPNLTGSLAVTKSGPGLTTLAGTTPYTGSTTIAGGTLRLGAAATVGGSPLVNIRPTGILDATLVASGTFTMLGGQTFRFTLDPDGAGTAGLLEAPALDIADAVVDFAPLGALDDPVYELASYTSLVGTEFAVVTNLPDGYHLDYSYGGNTIALVPEPSVIGLLLGAAAGIAMARRRRRHL